DVTDSSLRGHAVEVRLYAEDPRSFLPQAGRLERLRLPEGVRVDSGMREGDRSEEHTSELQSPCNLVCRLLLEKKKKKSSKTTSNDKRSQAATQPPPARGCTPRERRYTSRHDLLPTRPLPCLATFRHARVSRRAL